MACDGPAVVSEKVTEGVGREAEGQKPRVQKTAPEQAPWSDWQRVGVLQARHARNGVATACVGSSAGRWNHPGRGGAERGPNAADDLWPDPLVIRHAAAVPYVVDRLRGQVGSGAPFCPCAMHRAGSLRPDTRSKRARINARKRARGLCRLHVEQELAHLGLEIFGLKGDRVGEILDIGGRRTSVA